MIPTMILFGLVFGWWWRWALAAAAVVWPVVLVATGTVEPSWQAPLVLVGAALAGAANAGVGVLVDQGILWLVRRGRAVVAPDR